MKTDPDILSLAELGSLMTAMGNYGLESERCANARGEHLFEGAWNFTALPKDSDSPIAENSVVLIYSDSAGVYWGYSNFTLPLDASAKKAVSVEIVDLAPQQDLWSITAKLFFKDSPGDSNKGAYEQRQGWEALFFREARYQL